VPDLPAPLHQRLVWWVAAALRERTVPVAGDGMAALDRALAEAALRSLSAQGGAERLEVATLRLAAAIDAHDDELPILLVEALGDRQLALFIAFLAHALRVEYEVAREIVLDPEADRLWLVLRALDLPRDSLARIGLALSEADPRRELDALPDQLEAAMAIAVDDARAAVTPLSLHPDYRAALMALERGGAAR
jgi:hypothetical protein